MTIITENVEANAVGVASRTVYEVKQRWKGLFSTAKHRLPKLKIRGVRDSLRI